MVTNLEGARFTKRLRYLAVLSSLAGKDPCFKISDGVETRFGRGNRREIYARDGNVPRCSTRCDSETAAHNQTRGSKAKLYVAG